MYKYVKYRRKKKTQWGKRTSYIETGQEARSSDVNNRKIYIGSK